ERRVCRHAEMQETGDRAKICLSERSWPRFIRPLPRHARCREWTALTVGEVHDANACTHCQDSITYGQRSGVCISVRIPRCNQPKKPRLELRRAQAGRDDALFKIRVVSNSAKLLVKFYA